MEKIQETFNKDPEELKSKQTMMNNTINEIKNSKEGINSRGEGRNRVRGGAAGRGGRGLGCPCRTGQSRRKGGTRG